MRHITVTTPTTPDFNGIKKSRLHPPPESDSRCRRWTGRQTRFQCLLILLQIWKPVHPLLRRDGLSSGHCPFANWHSPPGWTARLRLRFALLLRYFKEQEFHKKDKTQSQIRQFCLRYSADLISKRPGSSSLVRILLIWTRQPFTSHVFKYTS